MKKFLLVVLIILSSQTIYCQIIIMEEDGGVYKIPCLVNGAKMKMIFDTGASSVYLSLTMAEYLLENDYISINDFIGEGKSVVADGTIVDHLVLNIRDIEISGLHLANIRATVVAAQNAPLLLGQSAIQQLGKITLSGNKLIIGEDVSIEYTIDYWAEKGYEYLVMGEYNKAYEAYTEAYILGTLSDNILYNYAISAMNNKRYSQALNIFHEIKNYDSLIKDKIDVYMAIGKAYCLNKEYNQAINYVNKSIKSHVSQSVLEDAEKHAYLANIYGLMYNYRLEAFYFNMAYCRLVYFYMYNENYKVDDLEAYIHRDVTCSLYSNEKSFRYEYPEVKKALDEYYYKSQSSSFQAGLIKYNDFIKLLKELALCGNPWAIDALQRL